MTILVDEARWPWRGTTWCHLVTDSHLPELHDFARELGCRRIGFQGDHYDIDIDTRERALTVGATATSSRELVRRLRAADLRLRPSQFEKWSLVGRWSHPLDLHELEHRILSSGDLVAVDLRPAAAAVHPADGAFLVRRQSSTAIVVHGVSDRPGVTEDADRGVYSRIDHRGSWAVEVTSNPLLPTQ